MSKKIKSARGEILDLDLMKIKTSMENKPKTANVIEREEFIDQKLRRHIRRNRAEQAQKLKEQQLAQQAQTLTEMKDETAKVREVVQPKLEEEPKPKRRVRRKKKDASTTE